MSTTVADHLLERLREWGVEQVFGYPGDGINGILGAFSPRRRPAAVHPGAARGDGGVRGRRATPSSAAGRRVCMATSGPGAIHLLNGLYDAKLDHVPGGRHRRADQPDGDGRQLPAGGRPAQPVQGRRQRLRADGDGARAAAERARPGHPGRDRAGVRRPRSSSPTTCRSWTTRRPRTSSRWCRRASGTELAHRRRRRRGRPARRRRPQRRVQGRDAGRSGRARRAREVEQVADAARAPAWPRRCSARTCSPTSCRSSPARSGCSAPARATR